MNITTTQVAEISISYRPAIADKPVIISALDAYLIFYDFFPINIINLQESFMVMYLNRANRCLGVFPASIGGITGTVADVRLILSVALKIVATSILISHNHPSGNLKPSTADIDLTYKIKEGGKLLDIRLIDHLIISPNEKDYFSFAENGIL